MRVKFSSKSNLLTDFPMWDSGVGLCALCLHRRSIFHLLGGPGKLAQVHRRCYLNRCPVDSRSERFSQGTPTCPKMNAWDSWNESPTVNESLLNDCGVEQLLNHFQIPSGSSSDGPEPLSWHREVLTLWQIPGILRQVNWQKTWQCG